MNIEQVKCLQDVINVAIEHGGDPGGAYFCNADELGEKVDELVRLFPNISWSWGSYKILYDEPLTLEESDVRRDYILLKLNKD